MPRCLNDLSWRSIKGYGEMAPYVFSPGDYKDAQLTDGTTVRWQIIGFNHDVTPGGRLLPFTFDLVDCLPSLRYRMNVKSTTEGSWETSELRMHLNHEAGRIYQLIPDEIHEVVEVVLKKTNNVNNDENLIIETADKFFLLSEKERFGRCFYSAPGEGSWYEYYRQEDVSWVKNRNGIPECVWLRSSHASSSTYFCCVCPNGAQDFATSDYSYGISFGLCF